MKHYYTPDIERMALKGAVWDKHSHSGTYNEVF